MYKVEKAIFPHQLVGSREEYLLQDSMFKHYPLHANCFIKYKATRSVGTGRQYAYRLCKYLNFLRTDKLKEYYDATEKDVHDFFYSLMYGSSNNIVYIGSAKVTYQTLMMYHSILTGFYRYVQSRGVKLSLELKKDTKSNRHSFFYGQTYSQNVFEIVDRSLLRLKSRKDYDEFYDFEDRQRILQSFLTIRDEVIFRLSLLGCRIDEILSLRIFDYNDQSGSISLYSSKGKETSKVNAVIQLDNPTIVAMNNYIENERTSIVKNAIKLNMRIPESLFLSMKSGTSFGKPLTYRNYLTILKRSCSRVGYDSSKIRTHAGRKTRNMDLLHIQQDHPELNLTDLTIQQMMRWKSPESQTPYRNAQDFKTQHFIANQVNILIKESNKE